VSTETGRDRTIGFDLDAAVGGGPFRLLAIVCIAVLIGSYVYVLRDVTQVVGGTESLLAVVASMIVAATVLARAIRPRTATVTAAIAGAIGFSYYLEVTGAGAGAALGATGTILADTTSLATGLPLLRMLEVGVWTLGFAPGPAFLSWYLAVRGRYALSAVPAGAALLFLVLTGDAGTMVTLVGTSAAIAAVGFGELERRGGSIAQADLLAVVFAAIIVLSLSVTFLPGSDTGSSFAAGDGTLEGTIDTADEQSGISGQVDLSPEVRFTAQSEEPTYWRTGIYDRFAGDEWVRSGQVHSYDGGIDGPPGDHETVTQHVTAETKLGVLPSAPQQIELDGAPTRHAEVTSHDQPQPVDTLVEGDEYTVESAVLDADPDELRAAGTNYPSDIIDDHDYLQTPEDTSSEFEDYTANVTEDAETPYDTAVAIEQYLRSSKGYSLEVDQPSGNVAEEFLFEMDEGYCVYFATTMVQMLRAEDVPARYVTGYTEGQEIDDDTYVVRGLDAHAWVEVYFPEHGWVGFEPTPGDVRDDVHTDRLEEAREDGYDGVDTDESEDVPASSEEEDDPDEPNESEDDDLDEPNASDDDSDEPNESDDGDDQTVGNGADDTDPGVEDGGDGDGGFDPRELLTITREQLALGLVALVGLVAGAHRTGVTTQARREVGLYWHGRRGEPDADARRAYRRLERLLAREWRPRRRGESSRQYLAALSARESIDPRTKRVAQAYERAVYGGGVDREEADEAVAIVDDLARRRLPIVRRFR
jgi:transglutaminase-like putative cysteine protease